MGCLSITVSGDLGGYNTAFAGLAEFDELQNFRSRRKFRLDLGNSRGRSECVSIEDFEDIFDITDRLAGETCSLETDLVDHFNAAVASLCHHERGNVFAECGAA